MMLYHHALPNLSYVTCWQVIYIFACESDRIDRSLKFDAYALSLQRLDSGPEGAVAQVARKVKGKVVLMIPF